MDLVSCPTCHKPGSDDGYACRSCWHPIKPLSIEQAYKESKAIKLAGTIGIGVGIVVMFFNLAPGALLALCSLSIYFYENSGKSRKTIKSFIFES